MLNAKNQDINLIYRSRMRNNQCSVSNEHRLLKDQIKILKRQNDKLRKDFYRIENAMHQVYKSKKKYKNRYKEIKQKYEIMMEVKKTCKCKDKNNFLKGDDYQQAQFNSHSGVKFINRHSFAKHNTGSFVKNQDLTSNTQQTKQDMTAHTLNTIPSNRKSEVKGLLRKQNSLRKLKQSDASQSQIKEVGKIFHFKSQQKQRFRYQSSGSEGQGDIGGSDYGTFRQPSARHEDIHNWRSVIREKQRKGIYPSNYQTKTQYIQQENISSLKDLIEHLITQLNSFSRLQSEQKTLQKQVELISTQGLLSQKLQQVCKKLSKIESNQQDLVLKMSQSQYQMKENPTTHKKHKKTTHLITNSSEKLNGSFLRTIEEIGRDLSEWKIDYVGVNQ